MGTGALFTTPLLVPEINPASSFGLKKTSIDIKHFQSLDRIKKPLAIAMWDFSWILRHHRYGEFENWDKVLEELADRGYNAIRIDAMPQYVAADSDGKITEEFRSVKKGWDPVKWGNYYTMSFRPREALLEFLPKCKKYGIRVGLSSWFTNHGTGSRGIFFEEGGLLRAWTETLKFLEQHNLFDDNIIYVDLLNEFPKYHGYDWLKKEINERGIIEQFKLNNPNAFLPGKSDVSITTEFNNLQLKFQHDFSKDLVRKMKAKFPNRIFHMSFTCTTPLENVNLSGFGTLDYHLWLGIIAEIPHWRILGNIDQSKDNHSLFQELLQIWDDKKRQTISLADKAISAVADKASSFNITCGNTEGWGPVGWIDHPELNWRWVKEAGEICVDLARKHDNFKFLCSSNYTHPQFKGMWEDVKWHRKITGRIKA